MRGLVAGNWKMNGDTAGALQMAVAVREAAPALACDLLICPPATLLHTLANALVGSTVAVGGQDCHANAKGAHTGDISAAMLHDAGAGWVILGHSERRADHGETDALVRAKTVTATSAGLSAIVCVGETESQRMAGEQNAGTGRTPTEADVAAMHAFIRGQLTQRFGAAGSAMRILYGGSVKPSNAAALLNLPEVGGALVGGASLQAADFLAIASAVRG